MRQRHRLRRAAILMANSIIRSLNLLDAGVRVNRLRTSEKWAGVPSAGPATDDATSAFHRRVIHMATSVALERLSDDVRNQSGAQLTAQFVRADFSERYVFVSPSYAQVPMVPHAIVEPPLDWPSVDMLSALPEDDAFFYSSEDNGIDSTGKSSVIFNEIQERYTFVGGRLR